MGVAMLRAVVRQLYNFGLLLNTVVIVTAIHSAPAQARITFNFNYTDANGVGFNAADPLGASRKTALVETGILLSNLFPSHTATLNIDVNGSETEESSLASAESNVNSTSTMTCVAGYNRGDVGIKVLGGVDPAPTTADGTVSVNFKDVVWGLSDSIEPTQFDFKSTMLHELLHAMGFGHSVTQTGTDNCGGRSPAAGGWVPYDQHLGNTTGNFINGNFVIDTSNWRAAVTGGTGNAGVLWRGANALAANSGNPIPLFTPTRFSSGSSVAHLDDNFYTSSALLMESETLRGPGTRTLSAIEMGIMSDIGFTIGTTPFYIVIPIKNGKVVIIDL